MSEAKKALFADKSAHDYLQERKQFLMKKVRGISNVELRSTRSKIEEKLAKEFACRVPRVKENEIWVERAGMLNADTIKVNCHVPFDGDAVHFTLRPGHSEGGSPTDVRLEKSEIVFSLTAKVSNPDSFKETLKGQLGAVSTNLAAVEAETRPFNDSVLTTVRERIDLILADTKNADTFMANLGYPEKRAK